MKISRPFLQLLSPADLWTAERSAVVQLAPGGQPLHDYTREREREREEERERRREERRGEV